MLKLLRRLLGLKPKTPAYCPHCRSIGSIEHVGSDLFICTICMSSIISNEVA